MKTFFRFSALVSLIVLLCGSGFCKKAEAANVSCDNISFYKVPLVCPAATHIGCGSKAKPVLLELEKKNDVVSEAWLNRAGTVIAIIWKDNPASELRATTADAIFKANKIEVTLSSGKEHNELLLDFHEKKNWYRGADVDKLSLEEADVIAERLVKRLNSQTPISKEISATLKQEFANVFKTAFTAIKPSAEVNSDEKKTSETYKQKREAEILEIGKKYLNETEMNALKDAVALGLRPTEEECKGAKSGCSPKGTKKSCCSKPK